MLKGRKHPFAAFPSPRLLSRVSAQLIDSSSDKQAWRKAASGAHLSGPKHKVVFGHGPADLRSSQIPPLCPQIPDNGWLGMTYCRLKQCFIKLCLNWHKLVCYLKLKVSCQQTANTAHTHIYFILMKTIEDNLTSAIRNWYKSSELTFIWIYIVNLFGVR